ncbi:SRPBCC family protein [Acetobacter conturbans]|uniref:SRPBCC family protein n=1 Tax=Acetobacter conturbans TaxID=1737472 RepID=A0ABX0K1L9_9PROT|nr:SRPBCC family protein [Acetobacter conturbans]NHN87922.1 SRPBCC family protein [Acetobacter conturbans]
MINVSGQIEVGVAAETAWKLLGGFDNLPVWIGMIESSVLEEGGRVRRLTTRDGTVIVERLLTFSEQERCYTYSYVEGPDPVKDYVGEVRVRETGAGTCLISWGSRFEPVGLSEDEAQARYAAAYGGAVAHVKDMLEKRV